MPQVNKKAQVVAMDLTLAVAVFAVISVLILMLWSIYQIRLQDNINNGLILNVAFTFSDYLISNPGKPTNWNSSNVQGIGLINRDRYISEAKLNNLSNINYNKTKSLFQINMYNYEYYLLLSNYNLTNPTIYYAYGLPAPNNAKKVIKLKRYVIYNNDTATFEVTIWKN